MDEVTVHSLFFYKSRWTRNTMHLLSLSFTFTSQIFLTQISLCHRFFTFPSYKSGWAMTLSLLLAFTFSSFLFLQILVTIISLVSLFSFHFSFFTNLGGSVTDHTFNFSPITYSFLQIRVDVMTPLSLVKPFHPHFFFCTNQSGRGDPAFTFCRLFTLPFFSC